MAAWGCDDEPNRDEGDDVAIDSAATDTTAMADSRLADAETVTSDTDSNDDIPADIDSTDELPTDVSFDEAPARTISFDRSQAVFPNPERGFYRYVELVDNRDFTWVVDGGHRLVFSYVRLDDFRDAPLPDTLLDDVRDGLSALRDAGLKVVLRFAYNAGPYPDSEPDASRERILEHIGQLEPVLRANSDVIAVVQAGFIGAWGEWHTSTHGLLDDPADREAILTALLDALPRDRMTQLRYPPYKEEMFGGPLERSTAHDGSYAARVGHHNDCFLASDTDLGTYPSDAISTWKDFVAAETRFVPMGGETCATNPPRSTCDTAIAEMELLHFTYINQDYHPEVVDGWQTQGCYDEMRRRLGYRLALESAVLPESARPGGRITVRLRLVNRGFAAPFNPRPVVLVLDGPTRHELQLSSVDPRWWTPGDTHVVETRLQLPGNLESGEYALALWLPDAEVALRDRPAYAIRLANPGVWDASSGTNLLTTVEISDSAPGDADPDAQKFEEVP